MPEVTDPWKRLALEMVEFLEADMGLRPRATVNRDLVAAWRRRVAILERRGR